jgi:hypothetical protein
MAAQVSCSTGQKNTGRGMRLPGFAPVTDERGCKWLAIAMKLD